MLFRVFIFLVSLTTTIGSETETRKFEIADWYFVAPADTKKETQKGPDFTITRFEFPSVKASMGIYDGGYPSPFAARAKEIKTMKDVIGGQDVIWSIWTQRTTDLDLVMAETLMTSRVTVYPADGSHPAYEYKEQFHIFITAPDHQARIAVQKIIRTLGKTGQSKPSVSTPSRSHSLP